MEFIDRHEAEVADLRKSNTALSKANQKLTIKAAELDVARDTLLTLTDDNDVLRHSASRLPQVDKQLATAKEKIASLLPLKDQLLSLEKSNGIALDQLVALEKSAATVPGLRKQVESYRKRSAEAEMKGEGMEAEIEELRRTGEKMKRLNAALGVSVSFFVYSCKIYLSFRSGILNAVLTPRNYFLPLGPLLFFSSFLHFFIFLSPCRPTPSSKSPTTSRGCWWTLTGATGTRS